jgi:uncharacterized membrane protein
MADSLMIKENFELLLGGHFDLYLVLFSPLVYLFGTYTLLIVQLVFILFGGIGVFSYFKIKGNYSTRMAYFATIYFYLFFGVFSAVSVDYHSIVVASCLIPWFFYFFQLHKYYKAATLVFLILISQENISLLVIFLFLGLAIEYRKSKVDLYLLSAFSILSLLYFIIVTQILIPSFSSTGHTKVFHILHLAKHLLMQLKVSFSTQFKTFQFFSLTITTAFLATM